MKSKCNLAATFQTHGVCLSLARAKVASPTQNIHTVIHRKSAAEK